MEENTQAPTPKKSNMMPIIIGVVVLALLGGGAYVLSQNKTTAPTDQSMTAEPTKAMEKKKMAPSDAMKGESASGAAMEEDGDEKIFTVTASPFKFDPAEIRVKKGDEVKIIFKNAGGMHDWVVDEFEGAHTKQIKSGETDTITFVADKAGTFEYYCSVGNHRQMGMKGDLIVE
jgi:plastocyanin